MSRFIPARVANPDSCKPAPERLNLGKRPILIGAAAVVLLAAAFIYRTAARGGPTLVKTNADRAYDPAKDRPAEPAYREDLDGSRYRNHTLGLRVTAPDDWKVVLGSRPAPGQEHEGLLVRMQPGDKPDPKAPLVSVVRRRLPDRKDEDPVAYIRARLLGAGKDLLAHPRPVSVNGRPMGRVEYKMETATGVIRVAQLVHVRDGQAIIVTGFSPIEGWEAFAATFEGVIGSAAFGS